MSNSKISFMDIAGLHQELKGELQDVFNAVLETAAFVGGPMVADLEKAFATYCEVDHCIGVGSGTDALRFGLIAAGVKPGDGVVTVPNTFIATAEAISQVGAQPEFVDIDPNTYNMDPEKLREYLSVRCTVDGDGRPVSHRTGRRISAVVPVHLYGQTADMDPILELAEQYRLIVIEDACQAHGAQYFSKKENRWRKAGSMGRVAAFSFYPGKNLGACGEAGAITTNDVQAAKMCRMLRDHGQSTKYYHQVEGYNGRLDSMQAGILCVKLAYLDEWTARRQDCARQYRRLLEVAHDDIVLPHEPSWSKAVYHLYVICVKDRDGLQAHLSHANIDTGIHYPVPLHLQNAYVNLSYKAGDFPVTESRAKQILSLPMHPGLTSDQQLRVAQEVLAFVSVGTQPELAVAVAAGAD